MRATINGADQPAIGLPHYAPQERPFGGPPAPAQTLWEDRQTVEGWHAHVPSRGRGRPFWDDDAPAPLGPIHREALAATSDL